MISSLYRRLCYSSADLRKENELRFSSCEVKHIMQLSGTAVGLNKQTKVHAHTGQILFACESLTSQTLLFKRRYFHQESDPNKTRCVIINVITLAHYNNNHEINTSFIILSWGSLVSIIVGSTKYPFLSSHFPPAITVRLGDDLACSSQPLILPKDLQKRKNLESKLQEQRKYKSFTNNKLILTLSSITAEKNVPKSLTGCQVKQMSMLQSTQYLI